MARDSSKYRRDSIDSPQLPELSDLDLALIERLRVDGRESNRALASRLNVSEVTVATHLRQLEEADVIRVVAVTDMRLFSHSELVFAMMNGDNRCIRDIAADVAEIPETVAVTICSGQFDIIASVLCRDYRHVSEMFGRLLPSIDGIGAVRAAISLEILKYDCKWSSFRDLETKPEVQTSATVDATDLGIIRILQRDARRSNRSIAAELEVSEGTVRRRIKRMLSERIFRIQAVSNVAAFGLAAHAYIGIKTVPGKLDEVAAALSQRDDISELSRVLDGFDFLAVLLGSDHDALISAVVDDIAMLPGIQRAEVFYGCDNFTRAYAWSWII